MSETNIDAIGQPTPPRLSEEGITYYKSLLDNAGWCEEHPAQASALRQSFENAIEATGQNLEART